MAIRSPQKRPSLLVGIIGFKFVKAVLFLTAGVALALSRQEPASSLALRWADWVEGSPRLSFMAQVLRELSLSFELHFSGIVASCLVVGVVVACEGIFLLRGYRWAPWLTIVLTSAFIPFEVQHLFFHRFSAHRFLLLFLNVLIVLYLYQHRKFFHRHLPAR
ncbi:MAG: DUF7144 family membrane protein [Thermoanaerobaculia bacterium]